MLAAMADGTTKITNFLPSEDCLSTLACLESLGVKHSIDATTVMIEGVGKNGSIPPPEPLDCGNSGTTMRLFAGILAGQRFDSILVGDDSLSGRPMKRIIEPLEKMGAEIVSNDGHAPLRILGDRPLHGIEYRMNIASAQIKSGVLLAGLFAEGETTLIEPVQTRDHTERMLEWLGADISVTESAEGKRISITGGQNLTARDIDVPGDISSAAFICVAASCLSGSSVVIQNVGLNPTRIAILEVLRQFGANLIVENERIVSNELVGDLTIRGPFGKPRSGANVLNGAWVAQLIDELPVLAVLGTQIDGGLVVRDASELRVKESDRISAIVDDLRRMNARVEEYDDGFRVARSELTGAMIDPRGDHRIAMAFAIAGLFARGETVIRNSECVDVSFPGFFETLGSIAA